MDRSTTTVGSFAIVLFINLNTIAAGQTQRMNPAATTVDLRTLPLAADELTRVRVFDPVHKKEVDYWGYPLRPILIKLSERYNGSRATAQVVFHCLDGYMPTMPFGDAIKGNGYLAVRQVDASSGSQWPRRSDGTASLFSPFYLVWDGSPDGVGHYPWPYQLYELELVSVSSLYSRAEPRTKTGARGFLLFRQHCIKCHSVNGQGGVLGGELNAPVSVTEYWRAPFLRMFIMNPQSVRQASRMPVVEGLSEAKSLQIIKYLSEMQRQKHRTGGRPK